MTFQQSRMNKGARPRDHGVGQGRTGRRALATVGWRDSGCKVPEIGMCSVYCRGSKETSVACSYSKDVFQRWMGRAEEADLFL